MNVGLLLIYILTGISLLVNAYLHGKEAQKNNFWSALIAKGITLTLIWWALGWRFAI